MKFASISQRLSSLGSEKWVVHIEGKRRRNAGEPVIMLSIGEPDLPPPAAVLEAARAGIRVGRLGYLPGNGELAARHALARHYTHQMGRDIGTEQFLFLPGTQTALYVAFTTIIEPGDEVILLDPYYATYEAVVTAPGGIPVPVLLDVERNFHPDLKAIEKAITPRTRAILLNSPSNPTGAVFTPEEIHAIGVLAQKHDLWIVSDEVYATQVHGNHVFASPFQHNAFEERVIVVSSISKSHAVPGFRSGWIAASEDYCRRVLPFIDTMLFGSQPFLEDALAVAVTEDYVETRAMRQAYWQRARALLRALSGSDHVKARMPEGGMFVMVDVRGTGLTGDAFAHRLLKDENVVTMPGESFGQGGSGHLRVALTVAEDVMHDAGQRIARCAARVVAERRNERMLQEA
jgi:arginine:pyruvate transaminase